MKIHITGASSYVGARLYLDLNKKYEIIGSYSNSKLSEKFIHLDITNSEEVKKVLVKYKPEVIIHAAANASATWCEANPEKAVALNQTATESIVKSANEIGAKVILISSFEAIAPISIYGKTKLTSEEFVKKTNKGYLILRPSVIIGFSPNMVNDRPFNRILKNLDDKTEPIYDTSWKFQPTYLGQVSEVIEAVLNKNILNDTIPVAVDELKSRFDIAKDILKPFGIDAIPVDKKAATQIKTDNLEKLNELNLPQYSYKEIIEKIVDEIKHRNNYAKIG